VELDDDDDDDEEEEEDIRILFGWGADGDVL
jgi:hypothetical protein